ncbi:hypothetical protein BJ165DRAFT_1528995 [Panaeolus papilionaceus]|nr:hypothetical protein BJ165DRAFT_1528995 [Panaeolus papilionaceus]
MEPFTPSNALNRHRRNIGDVWAGVSLGGLIPYIILAILVEALLYGIHVMLFISCVRILVKQPQRSRGRFQIPILVALTVMFLCTTADIAVSWHIGINDTLELAQSTSLHLVEKIYPKFILHQANSTIADILLIIRCYVVWGRRKIILYVAGVILVVGTVLGVYTLTILTAGRIMWIARQIKKAMGPSFVSQYYFAVAIVVESGLLYTGANVLLIILSPTKFVLLGSVFAIRAVCIMPILIIVQVATGKSIDDLQVQTSTIVMRQRETGPPVVLDTVITEGATGGAVESFHSSQVPESSRERSWHGSRSHTPISQDRSSV